MKFATIALILTLSLSGCAHIPSDQKTCRLVQPSVVEYSATQQDHMAAEIVGGRCPMLTEAMKDYGVMRDQARAASKGR